MGVIQHVGLIVDTTDSTWDIMLPCKISSNQRYPFVQMRWHNWSPLLCQGMLFFEIIEQSGH